jgi:hypothetical protein
MEAANQKAATIIDGTLATVAFRFTTGRGGDHPATHLAGYRGHLQADGYAGYNLLSRDPTTKARVEHRAL